jgi:DNA (cytosine-5)-methyltransferase 1
MPVALLQGPAPRRVSTMAELRAVHDVDARKHREKRQRTIRVVDAFCGAGGTSTGCALACVDLGLDVELWALNHWKVAIDTHRANHPWAEHLRMNIQAVDPRDVVPGGRLDLLVASPECTMFSKARGARPKNDQSRASAWHLLRWFELLYVDAFLIENVEEFRDWGALGADGKPLKSKKGETFRAFIAALRALGYNVEHRLLNSADYGDPTSRTRLFIQGRRGNKPIVWPEPTHSDPKKPRPGTLPWRTARECIDASLRGRSIFEREKPLVANTMVRLAQGMLDINGIDLRPFLAQAYGPDVAAQVVGPPGNLARLARVVLPQGGGGVARDAERQPLSTVHGDGIAVADPVLLTLDRPLTNRSPARGLDDTLPTILGEPRIAAFGTKSVILGSGGPAWSGEPRSTDTPLPGLTAKPSFGVAEAEAFLLPLDGPMDGRANARRLDEPMNTIRGSRNPGAGHVVRPEGFLIPNFGEDKKRGQKPRYHEIENAPLPAVTSHGAGAVIEPFLVEYYSNGAFQRLSSPIPTLTTKHRYALIVATPRGPALLDIFYRLLEPHELAIGQGFPQDYIFCGNKGQIVKQLGNAVTVGLARCLCRALLSGHTGKQQRLQVA